MNVNAILYAALRTAVQSLWTWLVGVLPFLALVPDSTVDAILTAVVGAIMAGVVVAGIRWLETRKGDSLGARIARRIGAILMVGLSSKQPVYTPADPNAKPLDVKMITGTGSTYTQPALK